jgi:hypothetical protein
MPIPVLLGGTFVMYFFADLVMEGSWMLTGAYVYAGSIEGFTIGYGNYYQFPLQEALFVGIIWTAWASVRFFRDDKGRTLVERGIDDVKVGGAGKFWLRWLAFAGVFNVVFLAGYNIPWQWFSLNTTGWPKDIQQRSYFTNGVCGDGTTYACPSRDVPLNKGTRSLRVGPDGRLIVPAGAKVPTVVTTER